MKKFIITSIFVLLLCGCSLYKDGNVPVYFNGTDGFDQRMKDFLIKPDAAFEIVKNSKEPSFEVFQQGEALGFLVNIENPAPDDQDSHFLLRSQPYLIVGDYYAFFPLAKMDPYFSGYYLNGYTGELEFRASDKLISPKIKFISDDIFTKVETLLKGTD